MTDPLHDVMPTGIFPSQAFSYVKDSTELLSLPHNYVAASALMATIPLISEFELSTAWTVSPNLYLALVGTSGNTKSPAISNSLKPLRNRDYKNILKYNEKVTEYELGKGDLPNNPQYVTTDITSEGIVDLLRQNGGRLLICKDELEGLFGGFNKYNKGADDSSFYESLYSNIPITVNRKGNKQVVACLHPVVSIIGGLQPARLPRVFSSKTFDTGIAQRFLFVFDPDDDMPKPMQLTTESPAISKAVKKNWLGFLESLADYVVHTECRSCLLTSDACNLYNAWATKKEAEEKERYGTITFIKKMESITLKFALIHQVLLMDDTYVVGEKGIALAIELADYFLSNMYRMVGLSNNMVSNCSKFLLSLNKNFTTQDAKLVARDMGVAEATMYNWLRGLVDSKVLYKDSYGKYSKLITT